MSCHRMATGEYWKSGDTKILSNDSLLDKYSLPSPGTLIRVSRLTLLSRIYIKKPSCILVLFKKLLSQNNPSGWTGEIISDFRWLLLGKAIDGAETVNDCLSFLEDRPKDFGRIVKKYSHQKFANLDAYQAEPSLHAPVMELCPCITCGKTFPNKQTLSLHMFKVHNQKDPCRLYLPKGTLHCPVCLVFFHSRERVLNHVRYRSQICRSNLVYMPKMTENEADEIDHELACANRELIHQGKRRHTADRPAIQMAGPIKLHIQPSHPSPHHPLGRGHRYNIPGELHTT